MTVYKNSNTASSLKAVEFTPVSEGNFSFFYIDLPPEALKKPEEKNSPDATAHNEGTPEVQAIRQRISDEAKSWLTSKEMGQHIVAETMVNGQLAIVTQGDKSRDDMLKTLADRGEKLNLKVNKKPPNFWAIRGGLSVLGHALHFTAAIKGVEKLGKGHARLNPNNAQYNPKLKEGMYVRKDFQADIGIFAALNQIANAANILLGHQHEKGENRLRAVKEEINKALGPELMIDDSPIPISDKRSKLHQGPQPPQSAGEKLTDFARENSVRFFEIFLRVLGTTALITPWRKQNFAKGLGELQKGNLTKAWKAVENKDKFYLMAGWTYLLGKAMSFSAKTPDPYSDEPHTKLDTIREKVLFKGGTFVEFLAAAQMAHHAFGHKKIGFYDPKRPDIQPHPDALSGIGGSLFAIAFIARFFAPFGKKEVDMEEVYAHATDTLAKTPPDKMPQLIAETSALLKDHFKDNPDIEFGTLFTKMMTDLYRYHPIALDLDKPCETAANAASPEDKHPVLVGHAASSQSIPKPHIVQTPQKAMDRVTAPAANHAEEALKSLSSPQASVSP